MAQPTEVDAVSFQPPSIPAPPEDHKTLKSIAARFQVTDEATFLEAKAMIDKSDKWITFIEKKFEKGKKAAHAAHVWFTDTIKELNDPYNIKPILAPKMVAFRQRQQREAREAAEKIAREQEAKRLAEEAEARRIQEEAAAKARELVKQGELRAAQEVKQQAAAQVQEIQSAAEMEIETIPADTKPLGGPGESSPWQAKVTDPVAFIKAVAEGKFKLVHKYPVRKKVAGVFVTTEEDVPVLEIHMGILNDLSKRMGGKNPPAGISFERGLQLRFSKDDSAPTQPGDGW